MLGEIGKKEAEPFHPLTVFLGDISHFDKSYHASRRDFLTKVPLKKKKSVCFFMWQGHFRILTKASLRTPRDGSGKTHDQTKMYI
jgi:hypothetical protein